MADYVTQPPADLHQHEQQGQGQLTATIYAWIRDGRWRDAIDALAPQLQERPDSRAALSLLGHCHFQAGAFEAAARAYEALVALHPGSDNYRLALAQAWHRCGRHADAAAAAAALARAGGPLAGRAAALGVAVAFDGGDLAACRRLLEDSGSGNGGGPQLDAADAAAAAGCVAYRAGDFEAAAAKFDDAVALAGRRVSLMSVCVGLVGCFSAHPSFIAPLPRRKSANTLYDKKTTANTHPSTAARPALRRRRVRLQARRARRRAAPRGRNRRRRRGGAPRARRRRTLGARRRGGRRRPRAAARAAAPADPAAAPRQRRRGGRR